MTARAPSSAPADAVPWPNFGATINSMPRSPIARAMTTGRPTLSRNSSAPKATVQQGDRSDSASVSASGRRPSAKKKVSDVATPSTARQILANTVSSAGRGGRATAITARIASEPKT